MHRWNYWACLGLMMQRWKSFGSRNGITRWLRSKGERYSDSY